MTPEEHRAKAERIRRSTAKLAPGVYEMVIEGAYLAGMHWLNYGLHRMGITTPELDVVHVEHLAGIDRAKLNAVFERPLAILDEIEVLRSLFVRGNTAEGAAAGQKALALYDEIRRIALAAEPFRRRSGLRQSEPIG